MYRFIRVHDARAQVGVDLLSVRAATHTLHGSVREAEAFAVAILFSAGVQEKQGAVKNG